MGFFSEILAAAAPIVGGLLGIPTVGAAVGAQATIEAVQTQQQITALTAAGAAATGAMRKQTVVQTLDAAGKVVKQTITKGGVAVFQSDVTAANRVARQVRRLDKRMPRKVVKETEITRLKNEVTEAALRRARDGADCPPKC